MRFIFQIIVCCCVLFVSSLTVQAEELDQLLQLGQESLAHGHYRDAEQQFSQAAVKASEQNNAEKRILVQALQGYMALQRQNNTEAEKLLNQVLVQAKQSASHDLIVRIELYLGQLHEHSQNPKQASQFFLQAVGSPEKVVDKSLLVSAYYQLAKLAIANHQPQQAGKYLQQAGELMKALPDNSANSQLWLNIGYQRLQLYKQSARNEFLTASFSDLKNALTLARKNYQLRIQAATLKHLASLYIQQQQTDDAIQALQEGIAAAQQEQADDLLIDLEWKIGQLYQQQNQPDLAIAAYRRAVNHIDRIRIDIPVSYQNGRSSFRETFAPIYLALADLLLRQSGTVDATQQQALLAEARDSIERMKKSELEDYFQSRCDISTSIEALQKTDPHTVAFYPISLPDRLEIIIYTADGLRRFTSQVTAKELEQKARLFSIHLRNYTEFAQSKELAQLLYQWLIAPVEGFLRQQHIETLVYIPDGALRLIPLAALYDGKRFVIENYAIVTSPGLSLIENKNIQHQNRLLLAGVSLPGNVVSELPESLLMNLVIPKTSYSAHSVSESLQSEEKWEFSVVEQQQKTRELRALLKNHVMVEKLQKLLSLPGVDNEIRQLAEQNHAGYLLNESFSLDNLIQLLKEKPHDILHIASHGYFGGTAEDSFIMTYDKVLNLNQLEALLSSDYFKQFPIDLLVLSACQTAEGNDRSPLGISGVAIRTKVHSALGSLWPVSDYATTDLMTAFYASLNTENQTKAKALQSSMLKLLKQKKYANPSYWSPFVLIGNWT